MKTKLRLTALLLAALMTLASCGSADEGDAAVTTAGSTAAPTETTAAETEDPTLRKNAKDNLPEDLNFDGQTIRIIYRGVDEIRNYDIVGTENEGDIVSDAVHQRNVTVEDRLGVDFELINGENDRSKFTSQVINSISTDSDDYDIIIGTGNTLKGQGDYYMDLADDPYLDFDQPWWWNKAMDALAIDSSKRQYLIGDFLLNNIIHTGAIYVNKNLYKNAYGDPNELYDIVSDGKWTLDVLTELVKGGYQDIDGSTTVNDGDIYGMITLSSSGSYLFQFATDIPTYTRNNDGTPTLLTYNDRTVTFVDKMLSLYDIPGVRGVVDTKLPTIFAEDKAMFVAHRLYLSITPEIRNMSSDFGVLPYPKLDEEQEDYRSLIHDCSSCTVIPKTNKIMEATTATLEAICAESYRSVTEKFYEVALKVKYARDEASSKMIDIIYNSMYKSFMAEYNGLLGGFGHYVFTCVENGRNTIASTYAKIIDSANKKLELEIEKIKNG